MGHARKQNLLELMTLLGDTCVGNVLHGFLAKFVLPNHCQWELAGIAAPSSVWHVMNAQPAVVPSRSSILGM